MSNNVAIVTAHLDRLRKRSARRYWLQSLVSIVFAAFAGLAFVERRWWGVAIDLLIACYWAWRASDAKAERDRHEETILALHAGGAS